MLSAQFQSRASHIGVGPISRFALLAGALVLTGPLTACSKFDFKDVTNSITAQSAPSPQRAPANDLRKSTEDWGARYEKNPKDKIASINYARGLRSLTQYAQAVAVLQTTLLANPTDLELMAAYGKALADAGRLPEAAEVLSRSHTPERPNWSVLSAQGSIADRMGEHTTAQNYYLSALKIMPEEPSILSNLGLSYALSKDLKNAEAALQRAVANPRSDMRMRQNLALVLALEGKFKEAEAIGSRDLSNVDAAANVNAIRKTMTQTNSWRDMAKLDADQTAQQH